MSHSGITSSKLAQICGVSQGTVDRALNNRKGISPQTKEMILTAAKKYGYRPNIHARSMAGGRSMLVGVVVFDLRNQYFSDLLTAMEISLREKGYSTVVMFTGKNETREIECMRILHSMAVDGIVLCPVNEGTDYENFLHSLNIPIVTVGNRLKNFPYAGIDNALAMQDAVEYVLQKGYDHLIYVRPQLKEKNISAQAERLKAFQNVCKSQAVSFCITEFSKAVQQLDAYRKNAFICPTDHYAVQLYSAAKQAQAGILGFDNIRIIDELGLPLDSVSYHIPQTVHMVREYLLDGQAISAAVDHAIIHRGSL